MVQICQRGHTVFKDSCADCKALRVEWYSYLKNVGFEDIENMRGDLIDSSSALNLRKDFQTQMQFNAKQSYYQWARSKANEGNFKNETERLIWESHAEGLSVRKIEPLVGLNYSWISRKLNKLKASFENAIGSMSYAIA